MANEPITRQEMLLNAVATGEAANLDPITRKEMFLAKLGGADVNTPTPITREEWFLQKAIENGGSGGSGGGASVSPKEVNFYDYDGTCLYAYTVEEAQAMSELPALPEREGLICQGWNYDIETIKAYNRAVNVGANYTTDGGATRIYITLAEGRTSPMLGVCPKGTVMVDWGDGTEPDTLTGTSVSAVKWTPTHDYAEPGDYVITLTVSGAIGFYGVTANNQYSGILRYSIAADSRNKAYHGAVKRIEIGEGVTSIGTYAFRNCLCLESITIPKSVTSIGTDAFNACYTLASITFPEGVTSIGSNAFNFCRSLANIAIPKSVTSIGENAFSNCITLASITIPEGVTSIGSNAFNSCVFASITIPKSVTSIDASAFGNCYALASITFPEGVTSIGKYTFNSCNALASITFLGSVTYIDAYAFNDCGGIRYFDFTACTSVPTLKNANAFATIPADCEIRVPSALYDEWIVATNWTTYASKIVAA